ncbi:4-(cytidine 5'-diphospho)-2-C-methyl-D-erythritol kinase [Massilia sp. W12]|uniref:4-(cytidine 5'-diphospho)-2-C-methyl-D-erythritol kinase n=1 Tax=Massilia sp. W12 TaxID=3126507 RepID=UPI0030D608E9
MTALHLTCPAKLNLFLHVVGRREDGYHLLQSVFQLIDLSDTLEIEKAPDAHISRISGLDEVPPEQDLCLRAARLLQDELAARGQPRQGLCYRLHKRIPMGGGLGGGSSDAASMLLGANHLWQGGLQREELMQMAVRLGADVPFFLFGRNAFVEGIGERMQAVHTRASAVVLLAPGVHVPTPQIFSAKDLTRNSDICTIADFSSSELSEEREFGKNDLQKVATRLFPPIAEALTWLSRFGDARMTGSGSCIFCRVADMAQAQEIVKQVPPQWQAYATQTLSEHPLVKLL